MQYSKQKSQPKGVVRHTLDLEIQTGTVTGMQTVQRGVTKGRMGKIIIPNPALGQDFELKRSVMPEKHTKKLNNLLR